MKDMVRDKHKFVYVILLILILALAGCDKDADTAGNAGGTGNSVAGEADSALSSGANSAAAQGIIIENNLNNNTNEDGSKSKVQIEIGAEGSGTVDDTSQAGSEGAADATEQADGAGTADATDQTDSTGAAEAATTPVTPGSTESISLNPAWTYADFSKINSGSAIMYRAADKRKNIVIGVNAGHGTKGGSSVKTYCHPDMSPKVTGGTTAAGSVTSTAVSGGMSFNDGTAESAVTLREAQILRDKLLASGYDVLMLRDGSDVQLDNIARTVICNNMANCHIAIHWDGDGLSYDKGCFYISTPNGIKAMEPVASTYTKSESLGAALINGLAAQGCKIHNNGSMAIDLTQTSFSTVPSVDIELGNAASLHDDAVLSNLAEGLLAGVKAYFP